MLMPDSENLQKRWNNLRSQIARSSGEPQKKTAQTGGLGMMGTSTFMSRPIEYRPEFASPDRWFKADTKTQIKYWRMFYRDDAIAGPVVDTYCEMPLSDYRIAGKGVDGEIKTTYENMLEELNFISHINSVMVEFLVTGEAIPHLFYDRDKGYWAGWTMHKPENIDVIDTHLVGVEPILTLTPDSDELKRLREFLTAMKKLEIEIPGQEFLNTLMRTKNAPLEPLCVSFIPRLSHAYDLRGTSLFSRLWRTFMFEDAVWAATIATAKRHAGPLKAVTLGDLASGFIPDDDQVQSLIKAIAQAEADPHAWVFVPPGTKFEAWGTVERMISIKNEYNVIEGIKLNALGVSKDVISGASTFASAQAGLQILMSRMLSFRTYIEEVYIYPKIFNIIAQVRGFTLPSTADVNHKIKTSNREVVRPKLIWEKSLKSKVDSELLDAYKTLVETFNVKISERSICETAGVHWEDELRKNMEENRIKTILKTEVDNRAETSFRPPAMGVFPKPEGGGVSGDLMQGEGIEEHIPEPVVEEFAGDVGLHAGSRRKDKVSKFLTGAKRPIQVTKKLDAAQTTKKLITDGRRYGFGKAKKED
jgi:hypothetical protein